MKCSVKEKHQRDRLPKNKSILQPSIVVLFTVLFMLTPFLLPVAGRANDLEQYIKTIKNGGDFTLSASGKTAPIFISSREYPGVLRVAKQLQRDISVVTEFRPEIIYDDIPKMKEIVIIGTIGKNPVIENLLRDKKLNLDTISGKWDTYLIQTIDRPLPGIERALVIVGSNKRGTIYGMYDLAAGIGVSPWYWWADVPVKKKSSVFIKSLRYSPGEPKIKYRGIFINDEAPALSGWVFEKYGGFNAKFYENVFELILRLKGNFLWPAMWGRAFYADDACNPKLADEYGIVISTSHHEPMMRAHDEWRRYGSGPWNYVTNEAKLRQFWREGISRMNSYESVVTLAMRGDGDEPMSKEANISLLERIVSDQRLIITEVTGKKIETVPQVWALYKEVQEYYDRGMRVPDDVTVLLCDDNWGNIRKLPQRNEKPRTGGYGIYYHYDYVGGPRNYKWLNTNQISRIWEQMHLAYEYGAERIWVVNVGDIKPMELPIDFFLEYAWNPQKWTADRLPDFTRRWAETQFGSGHADEIAEILTKYTTYNSRRKPELLSPDIYSLINFREAETVVEDYNNLAEKAERIYNSISSEYKDAFYQLVLHPVLACANLNELYVTVGKNRLYAEQGRAATNQLAEKARKLFSRDAEISLYYNTVLANGKWNHMMDQTHIGYTSWQQPDENVMPEVEEIEVPAEARTGVAIEGSRNWWPKSEKKATLPEFDPFQNQKSYIEIFNCGETPFKYSIQPGESWLLLSKSENEVKSEERVWISIDWEKVPQGRHLVPVIISGANDQRIVVHAPVNNPSIAEDDLINHFIESNHYISIEAEHFTQAVNTAAITWQRIPDLGRTLSGMTPFPVTAPASLPAADGAFLEYQFYLFSKGGINVKAFLSPTLNFHNNQGLRYAISIDNDKPQIINIHQGKTFQEWEESVRINNTIQISKHTIPEAGKHKLKFWAVDPGVILQKLVIETGEVPSNYLGPPESIIVR
jgi:hypothetical protein